MARAGCLRRVRKNGHRCSSTIHDAMYSCSERCGSRRAVTSCRWSESPLDRWQRMNIVGFDSPSGHSMTSRSGSRSPASVPSSRATFTRRNRKREESFPPGPTRRASRRNVSVRPTAGVKQAEFATGRRNDNARRPRRNACSRHAKRAVCRCARSRCARDCVRGDCIGGRSDLAILGMMTEQDFASSPRS